MSDTTPATRDLASELPTPLQCLRNLSSLILPNLTIFHDERAEKILDETVEVLRYGDAHAAALTRELEAARAFKAYVHKRLDDAGIPVDPESPHKAEGCRIGGRLDVVLGELEAARGEAARLSRILERDRSSFTNGLNAVREEIKSRSGMAESRGSYEWDDDRYRQEFGAALDAITQMVKAAEEASHAHDLTDCPRGLGSAAEVKLSRTPFAEANRPPSPPPGTESPRPAESTATRGELEDAADIIYRLARAIDSQRRCMGMEDAREIAAVVSAALAAPTPAAATPGTESPAAAKPCPLCGGSTTVYHSKTAGCYGVRCKAGCIRVFYFAKTPDEATELWNRYAPSPAGEKHDFNHEGYCRKCLQHRVADSSCPGDFRAIRQDAAPAPAAATPAAAGEACKCGSELLLGRYGPVCTACGFGFDTPNPKGEANVPISWPPPPSPARQDAAAEKGDHR